jgi:transcription initiation factor TFIIB
MGVDTTVVKCPDCSSRELKYDENRGERHCEDCGMVVEEDIMDQSPEWRDFNDAGQQTDRSRVGAPMTNLLHDKGLSSNIDWQNKDYSGAAIATKNRAQMYRMRKWQARSKVKGSKERNLQQALALIQTLCSKLRLPKTVQERSADIYRKALEADLVRGRSIDSMVCASIFIANQQMQTARTVDDIAKKARIGPKEIGRTYRDVKRKLMIRTPVPDPKIYINRFCSELQLGPKVQRSALDIIRRAEEMEMTHGKSPCGVAAASIYIASQISDQPRTQREIAEVTNVTEVTIRNRYKQLIKSLKIKLDL